MTTVTTLACEHLYMRHRRFVVSILLLLMSGGGKAAFAATNARLGLGTPIDVASADAVDAHPLTLADIDEIMAVPTPDRDGAYAEVLLGPAFTRADARANAGRSSLQGLGGALTLVLGGWVSHNVVIAVQGGASTALDPKVEGLVIPPLRGPAALTTVSGGANVTYVRDGARGRFSAALVCTQVRLVDRTRRRVITGTGFGPGLELSAGRDWWLGGSRSDEDMFEADGKLGRTGWASGFGVGLTLRAAVSRQSDVPRAIGYTTLAVTLALTASYD
ncbi:MAG TPA: hypothetical protein VGG33_16280 [Polyangia bacterium]